ncbi:MAG: TraE/TraK family type IV conjugative transfer system protein [Pseudomonas sp.]|nr:TraE/TraK family type IV conjugative transfer system protein [Pseudomonas sp.]
MLLSNLQNSFDGMRGENKFLRLMLAVLGVGVMVSSCSALKKDQIITVVPPTLTEQAWVSKTQSSSEYTEAWALYIGMLLGNVTPANATIVKDALGPILDPEIYQSTMDVLDNQIFQIRQDRVSLSFEPQKVLRDNVNPNRFFITGRSISQGPAGEKRRTNRTYEIELRIQDYKPVLSWISTNAGDARTQDVIDREAKKDAKMAERAARNKS